MDHEQLISNLRHEATHRRSNYHQRALSDLMTQAADALDSACEENFKLKMDLAKARQVLNLAIADIHHDCTTCFNQTIKTLPNGFLHPTCRKCIENRRCNWVWRNS